MQNGETCITRQENREILAIMRLGSSSWPLAKWQSQKRMVNNGVQLAPNHRGLNAGKRLFSNTCEERDDGYALPIVFKGNTALYQKKQSHVGLLAIGIMVP